MSDQISVFSRTLILFIHRFQVSLEAFQFKLYEKFCITVLCLKYSAL